jgi:hypothetical protein
LVTKAREVTNAVDAVMASHFTTGCEQLAAVKRKFAGELWLHTIEGEFSGELLAEDETGLRRTGGARHDNLNIIGHYDAIVPFAR